MKKSDSEGHENVDIGENESVVPDSDPDSSDIEVSLSGWDSSVGTAVDHHATGPVLNTCSWLILAGGWLSPPSICG